MNKSILALVASVFACGTLAAGELAKRMEVASIFMDNMVVPRDCEVTVWGWAPVGEEVSVTFAGQTAKAAANADGVWEAKLAAMPASSEGRTLSVVGKTGAKTFRNVLVGDVWLCGGQSNMDFNFSWGPICGDEKFRPEADRFPQIRFCAMKVVETPNKCRNAVFSSPWTVVSSNAVQNCTAVGYFFARRLHLDLGVPIGILDDNASGTEIEVWLPPSAADRPELAHLRHDRRLGLEYNGMIEPIGRFPVKGAIWYQGCSNVGNLSNNSGEDHAPKLRALIEGWRALWKRPIPFYYVQLHGWTKKTSAAAGTGLEYALIREDMARVRGMDGVGMAVAIDLGGNPEPRNGDLHPWNKYDVGERLARWALNRTYARADVVASGPSFKSMSVNGREVTLSFENAEGLRCATKKGVEAPVATPDATPANFAIAGADRQWAWADSARIVGTTVVVSSAKVAEPVAVRYAFTGHPQNLNLYNAAGLPMLPFRTDDWVRHNSWTRAPDFPDFAAGTANAVDAGQPERGSAKLTSNPWSIIDPGPTEKWGAGKNKSVIVHVDATDGCVELRRKMFFNVTESKPEAARAGNFADNWSGRIYVLQSK